MASKFLLNLMLQYSARIIAIVRCVRLISPQP